MMAVGQMSPTCGESASLSAAAHSLDEMYTDSMRPLIALITSFNVSAAIRQCKKHDLYPSSQRAPQASLSSQYSRGALRQHHRQWCSIKHILR